MSDRWKTLTTFWRKKKKKKRFGFGLHESAGTCASLWGSDPAGRRGWLFLSVSVCFHHPPSAHSGSKHTESPSRWFDSVFYPIYWFFPRRSGLFSGASKVWDKLGWRLGLEPSPPAVYCTFGDIDRFFNWNFQPAFSGKHFSMASNFFYTCLVFIPYGVFFLIFFTLHWLFI